jgi:hypothetical protein
MKSVKRLFLALITVLALTAFAPVAVPSKPGLVSPINKTVKVDPDAVTLIWGKSAPSPTTSPITDYEFEVADSSAINLDGSFLVASVVDSGNTPAPVPVTSTMAHLIPAGILDYGTSYYWHVRSTDGVATSAWSVTGVFRVGVEPPTLTALAPPPAPDLLTLRPTFSWTPGAQNADSYTIQISIDSGFSTIYRTATILYSAIPANQYIPTTDLTPRTTFRWRVRANNASLGTSGWSTVETFTTANPPTVPVLVSPNNIKVPPTPTLTWKPVSLQAGEVFERYEIEIFDTKIDVNNVTPVFSVDDVVEPSLGLQTTTTYTVPVSANLLPATTYYWRMKAYNADGEYSTSGLFVFYTSISGEVAAVTMNPGETLGNVPGLEDPAGPTAKTITGFTGLVHENSNLLSLRPIFEWDAGTMNAETFTLQVASQVSGSCNVATPENSTFASQIINVSVPNSQPDYTANFDKYPNYILCWRIRGNHSLYGSSDWSNVQIFKTANPPGIPVLTAPVDATLTNDNSPRLVWEKVSLPAGSTFGKYEVEISYSSKFTGYDYPADTIPPYPDPITYPIASPILPDNTVLNPVYSVTPPQPLFPKFPMVDQAHDPITDLANSYNEPWYDVEPDIVVGPPAGNPLYGAHTYYWRVRAYNSNGEYSAWSTSRYIRISPDRPTNLSLTDCAGNPLVDAINPRPCFDWDDVYGASRGYIIQISTRANFSSIIVTAYPGASQYQPIKDLPKDIPLYWRVSAVSSITFGTGLPSLPESFMSANPPNTPILIAPIANKLVVPTLANPDPVFTWKRSLYPLITTFDHYEIEIAGDKNFAFLVEPAVQTAPGDDYDTSYAIAPAVLTPARTYYWHVRACNDEIPNECSSWSTTAYFRTSVAETTLVTPPDNTNPLRPIFEWNAVNDATSYTLWISKRAACDIAVMGATISASTLYYQPKTNLAPFATYYWCVRANNPTYGPGAWSIDGPFAVP